MDTTRCRVVVLGGGYAGVMAANRRQGSGLADVTLVNPRPMLVERIRRHQLAATSSLTSDSSGRLLTDETLMSVDDARITAAGDAAAPSGSCTLLKGPERTSAGQFHSRSL